MAKNTPTAAPTEPERASDVTRDQILLESAKLFRHHGYAATTLRQIADAIGIKAGSIYYHFASKEEILGEVLDAGIAAVDVAVRERIDALPPAATCRDKIGAAIDGHLHGLLQHGDFTSANIRIYGQIPAAAKVRHRVVRRNYADLWDRLLAEAVAAGEIRADVSLAIMRLFLVGGLNWTVEWYNPQRGSFEAFSRQITELIFSGILSQPATRDTSGAARKRTPRA